MDAPKHQFSFPRGHRHTVPEGIRDEASDPDLGEGSGLRKTHEMGSDRLRRPSSPTAGLKPVVDGIRNVLPFGSPKGAGQHDQTRRNTGGDARSQVDPPHGGTDARVPPRGHWRDQRPLRLRGYMDGPASRASILSAARGEGRLSGFLGALAVVLRHRIAGRRRRVSDTSPTGLSGARFVVQPAYSLGPHSVSPLRRLAGGCAPSDPRTGNGAP